MDGNLKKIRNLLSQQKENNLPKITQIYSQHKISWMVT